MKQTHAVQFYKDAKGEWRWRLLCRRNAKIVADSGEGYSRRASARRAWGSVASALLTDLVAYKLSQADEVALSYRDRQHERAGLRSSKRGAKRKGRSRG